MLFEAIGPYSAISKIACAEVEAALEGGWQVTVVAKLLDESLRQRVEWVKLFVPPRGFALQWLTARWCYLYAIGKRLKDFDVIHGHQPQIADLCHVFQCHFSTRAAYRHGCLFDGTGWRGVLDKLQKKIVLRAEDHFYSHWNPDTRMIFVSGLLKNEFAQAYSLPPKSITLENAVPAVKKFSPEQRRRAREHYFGADDGRAVVGYLGGTQERKGYKVLLQAIAQEPDLCFLIGGPGIAQNLPDASGQMSSAGLVADLDRFYAACDVIIVPSVFDPCPVVVPEAISRGLPVVATANVGNVNTLLSHRAGVCWDTSLPLGPVIHGILGQRAIYEQGVYCFATEQSQAKYFDRVHDIWGSILANSPRAGRRFDG